MLGVGINGKKKPARRRCRKSCARENSIIFWKLGDDGCNEIAARARLVRTRSLRPAPRLATKQPTIGPQPLTDILMSIQAFPNLSPPSISICHGVTPSLVLFLRENPSKNMGYGWGCFGDFMLRTPFPNASVKNYNGCPPHLRHPNACLSRGDSAVQKITIRMTPVIRSPHALVFSLFLCFPHLISTREDFPVFGRGKVRIKLMRPRKGPVFSSSGRPGTWEDIASGTGAVLESPISEGRVPIKAQEFNC